MEAHNPLLLHTPPLPPSPPSNAAPSPVPGSWPSRVFSAAATRLRSRTVRCANLQQAYGQLLESVRFALHHEAVRVAQLEAENAALHRWGWGVMGVGEGEEQGGGLRWRGEWLGLGLVV